MAITSKRPIKRVFLFVSLFVLVSGALIYFFYKKNSYQIISPQRKDITEAVYGLGKVKSRQKFEVITGVISTVKKLYIDEGDQVKEGDPLILLDTGSVFRSPFNGTITLVKQRTGETVLPHLPILRVEDLEDRYIEISLEQQAALRIKKGQLAKISFETLRGDILEGKVVSIFPREDEFLVHVNVDSFAENILPGMTADVAIVIGSIKNALVIPIRAVSNGLVSFKRKGKWKKIKLDIGHIDGSFVEVLSNQLSTKDEIRLQKGE
jgi:macrolide-specific efflux system membrane fusion protein